MWRFENRLLKGARVKPDHREKHKGHQGFRMLLSREFTEACTNCMATITNCSDKVPRHRITCLRVYGAASKRRHGPSLGRTSLKGALSRRCLGREYQHIRSDGICFGLSRAAALLFCFRPAVGRTKQRVGASPLPDENLRAIPERGSWVQAARTRAMNASAPARSASPCLVKPTAACRMSFDARSVSAAALLTLPMVKDTSREPCAA
jgi:hypothetical protein